MPHRRPNLRSRLHFRHSQEGGPRNFVWTCGGIRREKWKCCLNPGRRKKFFSTPRRQDRHQLTSLLFRGYRSSYPGGQSVWGLRLVTNPLVSRLKMSEARHPFPLYAFLACASSHLPSITVALLSCTFRWKCNMNLNFKLLRGWQCVWRVLQNIYCIQKARVGVTVWYKLWNNVKNLGGWVRDWSGVTAQETRQHVNTASGKCYSAALCCRFACF